MMTKVIGEYTIHSKIGSGSFGDIYLAYNRANSMYALKIVTDSPSKLGK